MNGRPINAYHTLASVASLSAWLTVLATVPLPDHRLCVQSVSHPATAGNCRRSQPCMHNSFELRVHLQACACLHVLQVRMRVEAVSPFSSLSQTVTLSNSQLNYSTASISIVVRNPKMAILPVLTPMSNKGLQWTWPTYALPSLATRPTINKWTSNKRISYTCLCCQSVGMVNGSCDNSVTRSPVVCSISQSFSNCGKLSPFPALHA